MGSLRRPAWLRWSITPTVLAAVFVALASATMAGLFLRGGPSVGSAGSGPCSPVVSMGASTPELSPPAPVASVTVGQAPSANVPVRTSPSLPTTNECVSPSPSIASLTSPVINSASPSPPTSPAANSTGSCSGPVGTPTSYIGTTLAFDAQRGNAVLVAPTPDMNGTVTWLWNGKEWRQCDSPGAAQPAATHQNLVYDASRGMVISLSWKDYGAPASMTSAWDGSRWVALPVGDVPYQFGELVYEDRLGEVLFIHTGMTARDRQVMWALDASGWHNLNNASGPTGGAFQRGAVAWDPLTSRLLAVQNPPGPGFGTGVMETWAWDGIEWRQLHPQTSPPAGYAQLAWDGSRRRLAMLLGQAEKDGRAPDAADWTWDGHTWAQSHSAPVPPVSGYGALLSLPANGGLFLFASTGSGQHSLPGATWIETGGAWKKVG